jgi:hypothetical protein
LREAIRKPDQPVIQFISGERDVEVRASPDSILAIVRRPDAGGVVGDFRSNDHEKNRAGNLKDQILTYRHRCKLMGQATVIGLVAAILLIASLIFGALDVLIPKVTLIMVVGTAACLVGFILVIVAAAMVIAEGRIVHRQLDDELRDVDDLASEAGNRGKSLRR